jgi:CRISPR-associated protein Cmr6
MTQAAVPKYLDSDFRTAPPGHRFELYFCGWEADWRKLQSSLDAFKAIGDNPSPVAQRITSALRARQMAMESPDSASFGAISSSPFMTGMGIEHPLENGFAFLKPYGIPYLPGSSVKGVLRRAAEELALALFGESLDGWNILHVWSLFGFEAGSVYLTSPDSDGKQAPDLKSEAQRWRAAYARHVETLDPDEANVFIERLTGRKTTDSIAWLRTLPGDGSRLDTLRNRGALTFSDVFPLMPNNHMGVDILNPHYGDYYQKGGTPNDAGSPVPAMFLTVPEKSEFLFSVQRDPSLLPASLQETWIEKTEALFQYAFDWLGFGAKTAVGYGAMAEDSAFKAEKEQRRLQAEKDKAAKKAQAEKMIARESMAPAELAIDEYLEQRKDKNLSEIKALIAAIKDERWSGDLQQEIVVQLKSRMEKAKKWKEKSAKKNPQKDKDHQDTLLVMQWLKGG